MAQARPVALVTGASRGIGRSAALALAGAGYDVVINYASRRAAAETVAKEAGDLGARALPVQADVADDGAVTAMAGRVRSEFGRLDALVNNAGTTINVSLITANPFVTGEIVIIDGGFTATT